MIDIVQMYEWWRRTCNGCSSIQHIIELLMGC